ncbi:MAG: RNase adapter RapZ [Lachnospiraceae bacterium]|nr:RNase adapter RapZ [Lachnospiraceae bacterium]
MRFLIVTGMSGAGKSSALDMMEDAGFFCVDNLPIMLITKFAEMTLNDDKKTNNVALGIDIRGGEDLTHMPDVLAELEALGIRYEILFLDCDDAVLVKRYSETRRSHPLAGKGRVETGIQKERTKLEYLRERADYIIDTSRMLIRQLKKEVTKILNEEKFESCMVTILSFGFKFGIPEDADIVFDVRFLPNPYYVDSLKLLTGNDREVRDYVTDNDDCRGFMQRITELLDYLIPRYINEGKTRLLIAFGCTGGQHRSVVMANETYERLSGAGYGKYLEHRDIGKDRVIKYGE